MITNSQLYIDDVLVDVDDNTEITFDMKSNLLKGAVFESNTSYTIRLPKTVRNRRLLGYSDMVQRGVGYPYVYHTARYLKNGVVVIKDGMATLLEATDKAFEVALVWGVLPAFSELMSKGVTLNQLDSDKKILFQGRDEVATYEAAVAADVFYADVDYQRYPETSAPTAWVPYRRASGTATGRTFGGRRNQQQDAEATILRHPVVKASWLLNLIKEKKGVDFRWSGEAKEFIDSLIIPVIKKQATEDSYEGAFSATVMSTTQFGALSVQVNTESTLFMETVGATSNLLRVKADGSVYISVQTAWRLNVANARWTSATARDGSDGSYVVYTVWPYVTMHHTRGSETKDYQLGTETDQRYHHIYRRDCQDGYYHGEICGEGLIDVQAGDTISFEFKDTNGSTGSFAGSNLIYDGGTMSAAVTESEEVPVGGYFPITVNLPEIKVTDFVKFLGVITGTFPLNRFKDKGVDFVELGVLWENIGRAKDWTRKLIAPKGENSPQDVTFKGDFCRHNRYKWKADDEVLGFYDGDLEVENETLDLERNVMEFPFAATDGNNVPLYTKPSGSTSSGSSGGSFGNGDSMSSGSSSSSDDLSEKATAEFEECEPRILRLYDNDGKAGATFDIDMQHIIGEKYGELYRTLQVMKVVRESISISDIELMEFDEAIPVYLAQYGCYFAVLEMKVEDNGLAEVTMLQLIIGDGDE